MEGKGTSRQAGPEAKMDVYTQAFVYPEKVLSTHAGKQVGDEAGKNGPPESSLRLQRDNARIDQPPLIFCRVVKKI